MNDMNRENGMSFERTRPEFLSLRVALMQAMAASHKNSKEIQKNN